MPDTYMKRSPAFSPALWQALLIIFVFFALYYLVPLNRGDLWQPDETRYAEISREMLESGDWIVPHYLGLRYFEKPVAGFWLNNICQALVGHSNAGVRMGCAVSTLSSALCMFFLALLAWNDKGKALLASLVYLSMFEVSMLGKYTLLDPIFTMWMSGAMLFSFLALRAETRGGKAAGFALLGVACAFGLMTKGFLALVLPFISTVPAAIQQKKFKRLLFYGPIAVAACVLVCLPWALAVNAREPDYWRHFFWVEHVRRFASERAQHDAPFWYYLIVLPPAVLPWLGLLPGALKQGVAERTSRPELFFLFCWLCMPFLFFSVARGKLPTYILPCLGPLALLMVHYAQTCIQREQHGSLRANSLINILFSLAGLVFLLLVTARLLPGKLFYGVDEWIKPVVFALAVLAWGGVSVFSLRNPGRRWALIMLCPLVLNMAAWDLVPNAMGYDKQPQQLIKAYRAELENSTYILADAVGVAAGLAWEMKRDDIFTYGRASKELAYGLRYPDAIRRVVEEDSFPDWLQEAVRKGDVALVIRTSKGIDKLLPALPKPDVIGSKGNHVLFLYKQRTE